MPSMIAYISAGTLRARVYRRLEWDLPQTLLSINDRPTLIA
jgi:hypothetical protein